MTRRRRLWFTMAKQMPTPWPKVWQFLPWGFFVASNSMDEFPKWIQPFLWEKFNQIWPTYNISAMQISLEIRGFPFQTATFWGEVVWGRYLNLNFTRQMDCELDWNPSIGFHVSIESIWWLKQLIWKRYESNWIISPGIGGKHEKYPP